MTIEESDHQHNSFFAMVAELSEGQVGVETDTESETAFADKSQQGGGLAEGNQRDESEASAVDQQHSNERSNERSVEESQTTMPHDARRVLVHLMRQGVIIASQKPKLFESVCRYEAQVRRHLSEVYLQLVLDQKAGVVFVASYDSGAAPMEEQGDADDETEEFSSLIAKRALSIYDTLLLLVLRKHYQERESAGEQKITIDIERIESYLLPFLPLTSHASLDRKKLVARVKEMVRRKIMATSRGAEDRYEITPIIRYVVNASFLETMLAEYQALAAEQVVEPLDGSEREK